MKPIDLGSQNTLKNVLRLMLPAMLSQFITVLYNIVDRIYIGNLPVNGELSLIGAGVAAPITTLITSFAYLVVLGGAPLFSMSLGQKREDDAKKIFSNCLLMLLVLAILVMGLSYLLLDPMLYLFGASEASFPYAKEYIVYFLIGTIFAFFSIGFVQFLTAQGRSVEAMVSTIFAALANIGLDPLFMYVFDMGIKGAAIATALSWFLSMSLSLILILTKANIKPSVGHYDFKIMRKILKLGISPFIILSTDAVIVIVLNAVLQQAGGNRGDFYIECCTIVQAFFSLVTGPLLGISSGTQPILAYLYGAREVDLVKKAEKQITFCGLMFTSLCFVLSFFLAKPFASLFLSFSGGGSQEVIDSSARFILYYMMPVILLTFQYTLVDGLTGLGQARISIWLSLNRKALLLIPLTILLPFLSSNPETTFYAEPIADAVSSIVSLIVFLIVFPRILSKQKNSKGSALDNA